MDKRMKAGLVCDALQMALWRRRMPKGVQPLSSRIDHTNGMLATELPLSSRASFTGMASGLMGVNTNFGLVQASSMGAFRQIDQGLSNNTDAMQLLLNQGIEPAALGFGTLLPEQLGLFQDAHATTFTTAGDITNTAYTKMGLAASDFFDDVGYQASQVLGGLMTGEINSLDDAWETTFV